LFLGLRLNAIAYCIALWALYFITFGFFCFGVIMLACVATSPMVLQMVENKYLELTILFQDWEAVLQKEYVNSKN
jgi:hypothetical protein